MKTLSLTCTHCNGTLKIETGKGYSKLICPFCGSNESLLIKSDRVKMAEIQADTEKANIEFRYLEHQDRIDQEHFKRRGQIISICGLATVILVLIGIYVFH